jgi:cation diffusion facilitator CzcD-associated flavoprotein CzcO
MTAALNNDPNMISALVPSFPVGCRRITPGPHYLKSLSAPNVTILSSRDLEICTRGIKLATGEIIEVDAIICATGFICSFTPRFPLIGDNGNLQNLWKDKTPEAYMSCMISGMPNYFSESLYLHAITIN